MTENLSVIVPVYRDGARLKTCLDALCVQDYAGEFEVIIVNNDAIDLDICLPDERFRIIQEVKAGSYSARNAALGVSQGSIVAFTDSDCIPEPSWLRMGVAAMQETGQPRAAGKVQLFFRSPRKSASECYEMAFAFDQEKNVAAGVSVTANLFVRSELFLKVGLFDDQLLSGGDTSWNKKASSIGYGIAYASEAVVRHPARWSWAQIARKVERTTGGKYAANKSYRINPWKSFLPPVSDILTLMKRRDMSFREKVLAAGVSYRVKILRFMCLRKLRGGRISAQRS